MRYSYAGYYQIRRYGLIDKYPQLVADSDSFNASSTNDAVSGTAERARLMDIAMDVSQEFDTKTNSTFMPLVETHKFDAYDNDQILHLANSLRVDMPIMSLTTVTLGDGSMPTVGTEVTGKPYHATPIKELQLLSLSDCWTVYSSQWRQAIQIAAIWGHRSNFSTQGFIDSGDTIQNTTQITATETVIEVTDATAANALNFSPRFDIGQLIRVTTDDTDEYMIVTAVDYDDDELTVIRGQRGTTAAIHANGAEIDVFQPEPDIVKACAEAVEFRYGRLMKYDTVQVQAAGGAVQTTVSPELWPASVISTLKRFRNYTIGSAGSGGI